MERTILHCDLNNFYASVECRDRPELAKVPLVVGGDVKARHGIVLAKNEIAKGYGIQTAETLWQAYQKCPSLVVVPPRMQEYLKVSRRVRKIYCDYTDMVEPFGIDECWLDVTGSFRLFGNGRQIADTIRERVRREEGVCISVGVSFNKIFAKLGSDYKKPDAVTEFPRSKMQEQIWPLDAGEMLGVGRATREKLRRMGIHTIGDLAHTDRRFLKAILGKLGETIGDYARGEEYSRVRYEYEQTPPKSVGHSVTCPHDLTSMEEIHRVLLALSEEVSRKLRKEHLYACCICLVLKDNTLSSKEHQCRLEEPTRGVREMMQAMDRLLLQSCRFPRPVRMVGIRVSALVREEEYAQTSLYLDAQLREKEECINQKVDLLRERYGKSVIQRASLLSGWVPSARLQEEPLLGTFHK